MGCKIGHHLFICVLNVVHRLKNKNFMHRHACVLCKSQPVFAYLREKTALNTAAKDILNIFNNVVINNTVIIIILTTIIFS